MKSATDVFKRYFYSRILHRNDSIVTEPGVVDIQGVIALAILNRPRARLIARLLLELRSTLLY